MQTTDTFKVVISAHLHSVGERDPLFKETLKKPNKNIEDCSTYILNQVKASGKMGFADDEIFAMAIHYYDEDNIKVGKPVKGKVVVNHSVDAAIAATLPIAPSSAKKVKAKPVLVNQNSLFGEL